MAWIQLELDYGEPAFSFNPNKIKRRRRREKKSRWKQLLLDFNPPSNDKEFFLRYQEEYLAGNTKRLDDIYKLTAKIAYRMIKAQAEKKGFYICADDKRIKAYNCASYIIEQYIKRPDFNITEIGGYVFCRVRHELYYRTKLDDTLKAVQLVEPEKYFQEDCYQE